MKDMNEIENIISNVMDDETFDKLQEAENDYWEYDKRISRNGYRRMKYYLKKVGLTIDEYFAWEE